ncbi:hypothetical protein TIFTF001_011287 [Ficus carica]|uniref:Uncharacterized protein n=1 Tax=Ficus carica TaxID=3494 RepID=A0AA88ALC4_FICCA|nr:hypothetical protein TIFTF001_011287 [Ficus carica]
MINLHHSTPSSASGTQRSTPATTTASEGTTLPTAVTSLATLPQAGSPTECSRPTTLSPASASRTPWPVADREGLHLRRQLRLGGFGVKRRHHGSHRSHRHGEAVEILRSRHAETGRNATQELVKK